MNNLSIEIKNLKRYWIIQQIGTSLVFLFIFLFLKINIGKILLPILTYQDYLNIDLILPVLNSVRKLSLYVVSFSFVTMGVIFLFDSYTRWCYKLTEYLAYINITFFSAFTVAGVFFSRSLFNERGAALVHGLNTYILIFDILILVFGGIMIFTNVSSVKLILAINGKKTIEKRSDDKEIEVSKKDNDINEL
jgi:hypothetical protein